MLARMQIMPPGVRGGGPADGNDGPRGRGSGHSFWSPDKQVVHDSFTSILKMKAGQAVAGNQEIPGAAFEVGHFGGVVKGVLEQLAATEKDVTIDYFKTNHPDEEEAPIAKLLQELCEDGFLKLRSIELPQLMLLGPYENDAQRDALEAAKVEAYNNHRNKFYDVPEAAYSEPGKRFTIGPEQGQTTPVYYRKPENKDWATQIRFYFTVTKDLAAAGFYGFNVDPDMGEQFCVCIKQEQRKKERIILASHKYQDRVICLAVGALTGDAFVPQQLIPAHTAQGVRRNAWLSLPLPTTATTLPAFFNIKDMPRPPAPRPAPANGGGGLGNGGGWGAMLGGDDVGQPPSDSARHWLFKTGPESSEDGKPFLSMAQNLRKDEPNFSLLGNFEFMGPRVHVSYEDPEVESTYVILGKMANPVTQHLPNWANLTGCFHVPVNAMGIQRRPPDRMLRNYKYYSFEIEINLISAISDGAIRKMFASSKTGCPHVRICQKFDGPQLHALIEWYERSHRAARNVTGITFIGRQDDNITFILVNGAVIDNCRWVPIEETEYYLLLSPLLGANSILKVPYKSEADLPRFFLLPSPPIMYAYMVNTHYKLKELYRDHKTGGPGRSAIAFQSMGATIMALNASQVILGNHGGAPVLNPNFFHGPKDSGKSLLSGFSRCTGGDAPSLRRKSALRYPYPTKCPNAMPPTPPAAPESIATR